MKIPSDKLPLRVHGIGNKQLYGQYTITKPEGYAGRIVGKDLSQYVVKSANKFPEAIEVFKDILEYYELDSSEYTDGEILDLIKPRVEEFLSKLEDE